MSHRDTRHKVSGDWKKGLWLSLLTAVLWAILPLALAVLLKTLTAETIMDCRLLAASVCLAGILASRHSLPPLRLASRGTGALLAVATIGLFLNYLLFQWGITATTAGTAQLLIQLAPVLFLLASVRLFRERLAPLQLLGVLFLLGGFWLFFVGRLGEAHGDWTLGIVYLIVGSVAWAFYALAQKQLLTVFKSQQIMLCVYVGGALLALPRASFGALAGLDPLGCALLAFAAANTLIAYGAFAEALNHWEASRVSAMTSLTPVLTFALAWALDRVAPGVVRVDDLSVVNIAGAAVVVAGSVAVAMGRR